MGTDIQYILEGVCVCVCERERGALKQRRVCKPQITNVAAAKDHLVTPTQMERFHVVCYLYFRPIMPPYVFDMSGNEWSQIRVGY